MSLGFILHFGALTMPCKLSHRASAQAPVRICYETGNAVLWTFVIYWATETGVTNSAVCRDNTLLHQHMTWAFEWLAASSLSGLSHHFQGPWMERCQLQTVGCRIPEQECKGVKQDYTSQQADCWGVKKAQVVWRPFQDSPSVCVTWKTGISSLSENYKLLPLLPGNSGSEQPKPKADVWNW